ncbi:MAG: hypothetical protein Q8O83_03670 [bacterium]|nr:hypothetical protein [bacterium]
MRDSFAYTVTVEEIDPLPEAKYRVTVRNGTTTTHEVSLSEPYWEELTGESAAPDILVQQSFRFLLSHESNESILRRFSLQDIESYFPEYREVVRKMLSDM